MAKKNFKTKLSKSVDMKVDEFGNIGHVDLMQSISSVNPVRPPLGKHIPQSPKPLRPRPPVTLPEVSPWGPISPTTSQHLFFIDHITWQLGTVGEGSGMNELDSNDLHILGSQIPLLPNCLQSHTRLAFPSSQPV